MNGHINQNDCAAMQMSLTLSYEWRTCKTAILSGFNFCGNKWWEPFQHLFKLDIAFKEASTPPSTHLIIQQSPMTPLPPTPNIPTHSLHRRTKEITCNAIYPGSRVTATSKSWRQHRPRQATIAIKRRRIMTNNDYNYLILIRLTTSSQSSGKGMCAPMTSSPWLSKPSIVWELLQGRR